MSPTRYALVIGFVVGLAAVAFAWFVPLPVPFSGASWVIGAVIAFFGTLTALAWVNPARLWRQDEILVRAFMAQHAITELGADRAIDAITEAHARADDLRRAAPVFRKDLAETVIQAADRLDAAAREIFYEPKRLTSLRNILTRSELISEATAAHHTLVARNGRDEATVNLSRETLMVALHVLEDAFLASDMAVARGHLQEVQVASSVAEQLLRPRRPASLSTPITDGAST